MFEIESLREHLGVYIDLLRRLSTAGYLFKDILINISDTARDAARLSRAEREILEPFTRTAGHITFRLDYEREQGRGYYTGLCLSIYATDPTGQRCNLADGGFTDWTARLLSNAKERLLVSGMGIEIIPKRFHP